MDCRFFGAKPLPEPMLSYSQLNPKEQTSMKFEWKFQTFHYDNAFKNIVWGNGGHFSGGGGGASETLSSTLLLWM